MAEAIQFLLDPAALILDGQFLLLGFLDLPVQLGDPLVVGRALGRAGVDPFPQIADSARNGFPLVLDRFAAVFEPAHPDPLFGHRLGSFLPFHGQVRHGLLGGCHVGPQLVFAAHCLFQGRCQRRALLGVL